MRSRNRSRCRSVSEPDFTSMRVAIVHNRPHRFEDAAECGVIQQAREIETALEEGGYQTLVYAVEDLAGLVRFLERESPDLIFNCCEAVSGKAALEMSVAAVLEMSGIPMTG